MENIDYDEFFAAAENIRDAFSPLSGTFPENKTINSIENSLRNDFKIIYTSLYAMAFAELRMRAKTAAWYFLSTVSYDFEEIANMTAAAPFMTRGKDNFLQISILILKFFSQNEEKGKHDFFSYLHGVTRKNLGQVLKTIARSEKRLQYYVYSAVTRHVASCRRYKRRGTIITDLDCAGKSSLRTATIFEIVPDCAPLLRGFEKPGHLVDIIFDELKNKKRYACHLPVNTLKSAVLDLIKTRFIAGPGEVDRKDPMQEYLEKELLEHGREALEETAASYGWRKDGSGKCRDAYLKAAWDILEDIIVHGRKLSNHEAMARHVPGCDENVYRTTHKGSFQNFWKVLWENFLKKIRADI